MQKYHLLLVEKDPDVVRIFQRAISRHFPGIEIEVAETPDQVLAALERKDFHVIVCDVALARHEKINFTNRMCNVTPGTPILVLTADTDVTVESLPEPAKDWCVREVIHKPLMLQNLLEIIGRVLRPTD